MARMCRHCPEEEFAQGLCRRHFSMEAYAPAAPLSKPGKRDRRGEKYDEKWSRISRAWLAENPFCAACLKEGRMVPATVVDHILPRRYFPELIYSGENLQSLCAVKPFSCHQRKTGYERRGIAIDFARRKQITFFERIRKRGRKP